MDMKVTFFLIIVLMATSSDGRRVKKRMRNRAKTPLITGGKEIIPHSAPWQALLYISHTDFFKGTCGGSLLSVKTVITAAHCCVDAKSSENYEIIVVTLGKHRLRQVEDTQQGMWAITITPHPDYDSSTFTSDLCILTLARHAELNEAVDTIRLPSLSQVQEDFSDQVATATGWGFTTTHPQTPPDGLMATKFAVLSNSYCQKIYDDLKKQKSISITSNMICATGQNFGDNTCMGDSGGPLSVVDKNGYQILIGITSAGDEICEDPHLPSTFTRITSYLDWISETGGIEIQDE